ncbi:glycosyltransferase [Nocardia sp. NBC_01377]|uniref:glycosyltransferase n=1 Tax=Nocardia sp. NBC_01377 TaxID=2903595 RepID=UPI0032522591
MTDTHTDSPMSYLFACDEWFSKTGGISVVNRKLAKAVAEIGNPTMCLVESATEEERLEAAACGVRLVVAGTTPAGPDLHLPVDEILSAAPDVVVGHDRITGHIAWLYARRYGDSRLVHIQHTAPAEIEPYKDVTSAGSKADTREAFTRQVANSATVVAGIGPRLTRYAEHVLGDGYRAVPVVRLDPGLDVEGGTIERRRQVPVKTTVLVLGRTGDVTLKGLDIAAAAVASLPAPGALPVPTLQVRGAPAAACDAVHAELVAASGLARGRIDVRPYTGDSAVHRDLRSAALCLMPSRAEGFGLVAWEAIAAGTPVLLSAHSGAAELLREHLGVVAETMIVDVTDDVDHDRRIWADAIYRVLSDLPAAFVHAHHVRAVLAACLPWSAAAGRLHAAVRAGRNTARFEPIP